MTSIVAGKARTRQPIGTIWRRTRPECLRHASGPHVVVVVVALVVLGPLLSGGLPGQAETKGLIDLAGRCGAALTTDHVGGRPFSRLGEVRLEHRCLILRA